MQFWCSFCAVWCSSGAVMVQFWCSFSAVLVPSVVHKYLNTCTQVPISTQVSKYKNTITTNHTTDNIPWKCVNENANHQAHPSSKASMTHQVWSNIPKTHHRKGTEALALSIQLFMFVMFVYSFANINALQMNMCV